MSRLARQLPKLGTRETEALSVELTAIVRFVTPGLPPSKAGERHLAPGRHGADAPLRDPEALRVVRPQDLALVRHLAIGDRHRELGLERLDRLPGQDVAGDHARVADVVVRGRGHAEDDQPPERDAPRHPPHAASIHRRYTRGPVATGCT